MSGADLDGSIKGKGNAERIDPLQVPEGILSIHKIRYEFAKPYCAQMKVLDIACGAGYGTNLIGEVARQAVGVDVDAGAVEFAKQNYVSPKVQYLVGDALRLQFEAGSFGRVISFETIEHLSDIPSYLKEIVRVMRPGGIYIVSTPLVKQTTRKPQNPHHHIEYSRPDFEKLLAEYFPQIEMFGQSRIQSSLHAWLQRIDFLQLRRFIPTTLRHATVAATGTTPFEQMALSDLRISKDFRNAHDMIAVCRKKASGDSTA